MGRITADDETVAWRERNPLRRWRTAQSKTQGDVSGEAGVAFASVNLWETGARTPSDEAFAVLADLMERDERSLRQAWTRWEGARPITRAA